MVLMLVLICQLVVKFQQWVQLILGLGLNT